MGAFALWAIRNYPPAQGPLEITFSGVVLCVVLFLSFLPTLTELWRTRKVL